MLPRRLRFLVKKRYVGFGPMIIVTPARKRMFPIASRPLSKKNSAPRNMKKTPKPVSPRPIFLLSSNMVAALFCCWLASLPYRRVCAATKRLPSLLDHSSRPHPACAPGVGWNAALTRLAQADAHLERAVVANASCADDDATGGSRRNP